jgi:hypothetical protein
MNGKPSVRPAKMEARIPTFTPNCEPETKLLIAVSFWRILGDDPTRAR